MKKYINTSDILIELFIFLASLGITIGLYQVNSSSVLLKIGIGFFIGVDAVTGFNTVRKVIETFIEKNEDIEEYNEVEKENQIQEEKEIENVKTIDYTISNIKENEKQKVLVLKK